MSCSGDKNRNITEQFFLSGFKFNLSRKRRSTFCAKTAIRNRYQGRGTENTQKGEKAPQIKRILEESVRLAKAVQKNTQEALKLFVESSHEQGKKEKIAG